MSRQTYGFLAVLAAAGALHVQAETVTKTLKADGSGDYATLAEAVTAMNALAEGDVGVIVLEPGTYSHTATLDVTGPVTIRSSTGNPDDVFVWVNRGSLKFPVFKLENSDVLLYGLTVSNGYSTAKKQGGGVYMTAAATVDHCKLVKNTGYTAAANLANGVIRDSEVSRNLGISTGMNAGLYVEGASALVENCRLINNIGDYDNGGLAVNIASGTVKNSVISNNFNTTGAYGRGAGGIATSGACLIENCLIANNTAGYHSGYETHGNWSHAAGVHVGAAGCVIRNCTIADNTGYAHGGIRVYSDGHLRLENSIVWGNVDTGYGKTLTGANTSTVLADENVSGLSQRYATNVCTTIDFGANCMTSDPLFVDPVHGDYRLATNSPCIGVGRVRDGDADKTDVVGNPRLRGGVIDMGCFTSLGTEPSVTVPETETDVYLVSGDDIAAAVRRCGNGSTLHLGDGEYGVTRTLVVDKGVRIISANGPEKTSLYRKGKEWSGNNCRILIGDHADFLLSGVTVSNGYSAAATVGSAMFLRFGTITNCVFTKNAHPMHNYGGGVLRIFEGRVRDTVFTGNPGGGGHFGNVLSSGGAGSLVQGCEFTRNVSSSANAGGSVVHVFNGNLSRCKVVGNASGGGGAAAIYVANSASVDTFVENCLVANNTNTWGSAPSGGIKVGNTKIRIVNCTSAYNKGYSGAGVAFGNKVLNCVNTLLYGNVSPSGPADTPDYESAGNVTFSNCVFTLSTEITGKSHECHFGDPLFVDKANGDYNISSSSVCKDAGLSVAWLDQPPLDLASNGRTNGVVDIGCYEFYAAATLACEYTVSGTEIPGGTVAFMAVVTGDDLDGLRYRWRLDTVGGTQGEWTDWSESDTRTYPELAAGSYKMTLEVKNAAGDVAATDMDGLEHHVPAATLYLASREAVGHVAQAPYTSEATAATNLADLVGYCGIGTEIVVLDGNHAVSTPVSFQVPVNMHSKSGDPSSAVVYRPSNAGIMRILEFVVAGATLSGVTVSNGYNNASGYLGVNAYINKGVVSNCVFTKSSGLALFSDSSRVYDSRFAGNQGIDGTGAAFQQRGSDARCERCEFTGNSQAYHAQGCVKLQGGEMRRCRIVGNNMSSADTATAGFANGGLCINGTVLVENCLIANNKSNTGAGGIAVTGSGFKPVIVHSTVVSNLCKSGVAGGFGVGNGGHTVSATNLVVWGNVHLANPVADDFATADASGRSALVNCLCGNYAAATSATDCFHADPLFKDASSGDYRLVNTSPCVNCGAEYDGIRDSVDLAGRKRVLGGAPDLGCYESNAGGATMLFIR